MDGCLGWSLKLGLLLTCFVIGVALGSMYVTGFFDSQVVHWEISDHAWVRPDFARSRVQADATLERAHEDLALVDGAFVLWTGQLVDARILMDDLRRLTVRGAQGLSFLAYREGAIDNVSVGDQVEVLGLARTIRLQGARQSGWLLPQVLAFDLREINPVVREISAPGVETTGDRTEDRAAGAPPVSSSPSPPSGSALSPSPSPSPRTPEPSPPPPVTGAAVGAPRPR